MTFITDVNKLNNKLEDIIEQEQQGKLALFCKFDIEKLIEDAKLKLATWSTIEEMNKDVLKQLVSLIKYAQEYLEFLVYKYNLTNCDDSLNV